MSVTAVLRLFPVACLLQPVCHAQEGLGVVSALIKDGLYPAALTAVENLIKGTPKDETFRKTALTLVQRMGRSTALADALHGYAQTQPMGTYRGVLEAIAGGVKDSKLLPSRNKVLECVRAQRRRGQTDLPLALWLCGSEPNHALSAFLVGEAAGIQWYGFDPTLSLTSFQKVLAALPAEGQASGKLLPEVIELLEFLGLEKHEADVLRAMLAGFISALSQKQPIVFWRSFDGRLKNLWEDFVVARETGNQEKMLSVATRLNGLEANNPSMAYLLGAIYGSYGESFKEKASIDWFTRFLRLTDYEAFQVTSVQPDYTIEEVLAGLARIGKSSQMAELRMSAKRNIELLTAGQEALLEFPDKARLPKLIADCRRKIDELDALEGRRQDEEREVRRCKEEVDAEYRRQRGRRIVYPPEAKLDELNKHKRELQKIVKLIEAEKNAPKRPGLKARLKRAEAVLATYK